MCNIEKEDEQTIKIIRELVECLGNEMDIQFVPRKDLPPLPVNPFSKDETEKSRTSHYLLIVASIDIYTIVGRAENARKILCSLYNLVGEKLFKETRIEEVRRWLRHVENYYIPKSGCDRIPYYISKVNNFVMNIGGDLYTWGRKYTDIKELIDLIADKCNLGGPHSARKRVCLYMRWMVRSKPDLRIWDHLSPSELYLPLDRNVGYVLSELGVLNKNEKKYRWKHVEIATNFAKKLFPEDPVKVDYPFFLLGRWLKGKERIGKCEELAKAIFKWESGKNTFSNAVYL